jgi:hypothetical protein
LWTFKKLCRRLVTTFQPITAHAMARDKLHSLYQRESVQRNNSICFKTITFVPNMTEDEKVDKYTYGGELRPAPAVMADCARGRVQVASEIDSCSTFVWCIWRITTR